MRRDACLSTTTATGKSVFNHHQQAVHIFLWPATCIRISITVGELESESDDHDDGIKCVFDR